MKEDNIKIVAQCPHCKKKANLTITDDELFALVRLSFDKMIINKSIDSDKRFT